MNPENLLQPIQQLLIQAQTLVALANAEEWDAIQIHMSDYQQAVVILEDVSYLQTLKAAGLASQAQTLILHIQELNQQVDEQAAVQHAKLSSELRQLVQSNKVLDAYGQ